ncbi:glycogen/starch synthase [bacterium SCSIO 12741]|nr:glycogen/starch synthase [bacterium SCSIO 12741]
MSKARVLYVTQAMMPYLPEDEVTSICRQLPQAIQEKGKEIRNFMPRYGSINERRHQLHEVIRLSGMNLVIDDHDHPLIIKVASIPQAKMQVYFIDNEEYFKRKSTFEDANGEAHPDNDERMIFFCKGVAETVKKLGWAPDVIHCHGWFSSLLPLFIKKVFKNEPLFANSKVVYSIYGSGSKHGVNPKIYDKLLFESIEAEGIESLKNPTNEELHKIGVSFADGVIIADDQVDESLVSWVKDQNKLVLEYEGSEDYVDRYNNFYDEVIESEEVLAQ